MVFKMILDLVEDGYGNNKVDILSRKAWKNHKSVTTMLNWPQ